VHNSSTGTPFTRRPNTFVLATSLHALINGVHARSTPPRLNAVANCNQLSDCGSYEHVKRLTFTEGIRLSE
jgi:hypothetical protein